MTRPRLLDLFCGAGGAAMGYHRVGFDVVGVDIKPQPHFPFEFHQADALTFPLEGFDVIHASPPCQDYSKALRHMAKPQPRLIDAIGERLRLAGAPWVIENVVGAPLPESDNLFGQHGVMLCGTMFGLPVYRHRLFETSFPIAAPRGCNHLASAMNPHSAAGRERIYALLGRQDPEAVWRRAMDVSWMTKHEGREAIPPAYTEFIGEQLMGYLEKR